MYVPMVTSIKRNIVAVALAGTILTSSLSGCVEGGSVKALTPLETQLVAQVFTKRFIASELSQTRKELAIKGLQAARLGVGTVTPDVLVANLSSYLGPENEDIALLVAVLVKERVDFSQMPEAVSNEYLTAILLGVEKGLHS